MATYTIADGIKDELVEAFVVESYAGFHGMTAAYAVDTDGDRVLDRVYIQDANAAWNLWHDNAVAIPVAECFDDGNDYDWTDVDEDDAEKRNSEAEYYATEFAMLNMLDVVEISDEDGEE